MCSRSCEGEGALRAQKWGGRPEATRTRARKELPVAEGLEIVGGGRWREREEEKERREAFYVCGRCSCGASSKRKIIHTGKAQQVQLIGATPDPASRGPLDPAAMHGTNDHHP